MKQITFFITVLFLSINVASADWDTTGSGGDDWSGNVTFDNTTEIQSTTEIELLLSVDDYISYYNFNEGAGTTSHDENVTSSNDGTFKGAGEPAWTASSKYGDYAVDFDGTDDHIDYGDVTIFDGEGTMTVMTWVYLDGDIQVDKVYNLVRKDGSYVPIQYGRYANGTKYIQVAIWNGGNLKLQNIHYSLPTNTWTHIAIRWDKDANGGYAEILIDKVSIGTTSGTAATGTITDSANNMFFGSNGAGAEQLKGNLDEVYFYIRILSNTEVNQTCDNEHHTIGNLTCNVFDSGISNKTSKVRIQGNNPVAGTNVTVAINKSTDQSSWVWEELGAITTVGDFNVTYDVTGNYRYAKWDFYLQTNDTSKTSIIYNGSLYYETSGVVGVPSITSYAPLGTIWPEVSDSQLFNVTVNQSTQCRWYINGSLEQTNSTPSLTHSYTNTSLKGGYWNFTAVVNNTNGVDIQTWIFEVGADSVDMIIEQEDRTNLSHNIIWNITRIGSNVTHWNVSWSATDAGNTYYFRYWNNTYIGINQTATTLNETLWFNSSTLLPEGVYYISETAPLPGITNVTNGSISSTSQYIDWDVNLTANNQVIYDTGAQGADSTDWSSTWTADHGAANASDSNWSSYAESAGAGTEYLYFNYTIPANANRSHSVLHIKDGDSEANLTIPSTCWNVTEGTIYVRAAVSDIANSVTWAAYTGASWTTIRGPNAPNTVYEQEMTFKYTSDWNNSTNAPNITLSGLTASTGYNFVVWSYNVNDITRNSSSSTYSFTTSAAANASTIIIPANSYGMFNNWTVATNFSNIATNESNDVCYTYYNVTDSEWHSHYVGYSWNSDYVIPLEASTMMFVNAQTTVTATVITPSSTELYVGWNMLFVEGTDNESIADIITDIGANCTDVWKFNSTAGAYSNTTTNTVQPCQGILTYINTAFTWPRSDL